MEIRDRGLYRDVLGYKTFEAYCKERWSFNRRYTYYLIDSANVIQNVNNCSQIPATESQTRPLSRREPLISALSEVAYSYLPSLCR